MFTKNIFTSLIIFCSRYKTNNKKRFFNKNKKITTRGKILIRFTPGKKFTNEDGTFFYKKHKIYLYKEDFSEFNSSLKETCEFIIENKGEEVISEKHDKDFDKKKEQKNESESDDQKDEKEEEKDFADVDFENDDE